GSRAAGATMLHSTTCGGEPSPGATTRKPPPPIPLIHGSRTPSAKLVATAASTALPPAASTSAPTEAASRLWEATMPPAAVTTAFRGVGAATGSILLILCSCPRSSTAGATLCDASPATAIRWQRERQDRFLSSKIGLGSALKLAG